MQVHGLIPQSLMSQVGAQGAGEPDQPLAIALSRRVISAGEQVGALHGQPSPRGLMVGELRKDGSRASVVVEQLVGRAGTARLRQTCPRAAARRHRAAEYPTRGDSSAQVVVEQPADRLVAINWIVRRRQRTSSLPDQVVHAEAAASRLNNQGLVV